MAAPVVSGWAATAATAGSSDAVSSVSDLAQALIKAARVRALSQGRAHVAFEDIRHFADEVLKHRTLLNYDGQAENVRTGDLIAECVEKLPEQAA